MTVVYDNKTSQVNSAGGAGPFTFSHTCTGSRLLLLVAIAWRTNAGSPSAVSYNGVSLSRWTPAVGALNCSVDLWFLVAPATGANTVSVTWTGTAPTKCIIAAVSYTGVNQTDPLGTPSSSTSTSTTASQTVTSAVGQLVVDALATNFTSSGAATVGAGQTARENEHTTGGTDNLLGFSEEAGAASVTMSWTFTAALWAQIAVPLKPAQSLPPFLGRTPRSWNRRRVA